MTSKQDGERCATCICARRPARGGFGLRGGKWFPAEEGAAFLVDCLRGGVPALSGVILNINRKETNVVLGPECRVLWGKGALLDCLCGLQFEISPLSFYQVNHDQAERLYEKAAELRDCPEEKPCWTCTAEQGPLGCPWRKQPDG